MTACLFLLNSRQIEFGYIYFFLFLLYYFQRKKVDCMAKKWIKWLMITLMSAVPSMSSCSKNKSVLTNSDLLISEYLEGTGNNRAIELYNKGEKDIDLSEYRIFIYLRGDSEPGYTIELEGTLPSRNVFVVAHPEAEESVLEKADQISEKLMFNGSQQIALAKGKKVIDLIGIMGTSYSYESDVTLVRKTACMESKSVWDEYDWIRYGADNVNYLGNVDNSVTPEELEAGPRIDETYLSASFIEDAEKNITGGGLIDVTLYAGVDGDTAKFYYPSSTGIANGTKVRFQNINTPESYTENVQPWGIPAKFWVTERLEEATRIQLQSQPNGTLYETFDRVLAWVWTDGELFNYKIVRKGFSDIAFGTTDNLIYKDITYTNWLYDARLYAERNGLGIWGEKDPYWDYENNKSTYDGYFEI